MLKRTSFLNVFFNEIVTRGVNEDDKCQASNDCETGDCDVLSSGGKIVFFTTHRFVAVVVVVVDDAVVEVCFVTGQYFQHNTLFSTLS